MQGLIVDAEKFKQALVPFREVFGWLQPYYPDNEIIWKSNSGAQLTVGDIRALINVNTVQDQASSVPPRAPGPEPAEGADPPPAEGRRMQAYDFLHGFISHADPNDVTMAKSYLVNLLHASNTLDPKVTWSVDTQLAMKLGDQLEWLNTAVGVLAKSHLVDITDASIPAQIGDIKRGLESAIKTCNELGIPF